MSEPQPTGHHVLLALRQALRKFGTIDAYNRDQVAIWVKRKAEELARYQDEADHGPSPGRP